MLRAKDDNATSPAPCSLAPSGENSPSPWSRPVPRPPQLKFEVISRCKVKVRHPALKGQNNIAPGTRPGRQYIPLVFSSGSRDMGEWCLVPTPVSAIEMPLLIICEGFPDLTISSARKLGNFFHVATDATANSIGIPDLCAPRPKTGLLRRISWSNRSCSLPFSAGLRPRRLFDRRSPPLQKVRLCLALPA